MGFPDSSAGKESTCNAEELGSIPGSGMSPGDGKGHPLQYSDKTEQLSLSLPNNERTLEHSNSSNPPPRPRLWHYSRNEFISTYNLTLQNMTIIVIYIHTYIYLSHCSLLFPEVQCSVWDQFHSDWARCFSAGLLTTDSHTYLFENFPFVKDVFTGYRMLHWQLYSFDFKMPFHYLPLVLLTGQP